jgi:hypothetical protein
MVAESVAQNPEMARAPADGGRGYPCLGINGRMASIKSAIAREWLVKTVA